MICYSAGRDPFGGYQTLLGYLKNSLAYKNEKRSTPFGGVRLLVRDAIECDATNKKSLF